jgi:hypothetical protein
VPLASLQDTSSHGSPGKAVGKNEGLRPHLSWMETPDFSHV